MWWIRVILTCSSSTFRLFVLLKAIEFWSRMICGQRLRLWREGIWFSPGSSIFHPRPAGKRGAEKANDSTLPVLSVKCRQIWPQVEVNRFASRGQRMIKVAKNVRNPFLNLRLHRDIRIILTSTSFSRRIASNDVYFDVESSSLKFDLWSRSWPDLKRQCCYQLIRLNEKDALQVVWST